MKRQILFILFIIASLQCNAQQRKIKKLEVEEIGFSVNLKFNAESDQLTYNDLKLKITPLSTSSLNEKFLKESSLNGKFEYSHYDKSRKSYFLVKPRKKQEKSDFEFLLEGVDWLFDNDKINSEERDELVKKIILNYDYEAGQETYNSQRNVLANPYYVGGKYLNIFELEMSNPTNTYKKFDKKLLIETGNLLLYPLSTEELSKTLAQSGLLNQDRIQTLNRYNLSDEIILPPNSKLIKYFATVPIDYNNSELKISFEGLNTKFRWTIDKKYNDYNEKYTFFELSTAWYYGDYFSNLGDIFYTVKGSEGVYLANEGIFIGEKNLNDEFELMAISLFMDKLYFVRSKFKGADYIELEKNRRKELPIKPSKIDALKRKS